MDQPVMPDHPAFRMLRAGDAAGFNAQAAAVGEIDLTNAYLRAVDFRNVDLANVVLRGAYLRESDLRGQDLRRHDLEGASLHNAKVSGTWFSDDFTAAEIRMSVDLGTRLRKNAA